MRAFAEILAVAAQRKGGAAALEALLAATAPKSAAEIAAMPDDRILAEMTRHIFYAGLSARVVDDKWPGFERAFHGFDAHACAFLTDEQVEALLQDRGIVRNGAKIRAVQVNARFILELKAEHGGAGRFFADWPDSDYVGILHLLKKRGSYLGGDAAARFLRAIGKPAFIATPDVVAALTREGVIDRPPSGARDLARLQAAFNAWSEESGRDLTTISRVLALSVDSLRPARHARGRAAP